MEMLFAILGVIVMTVVAFKTLAFLRSPKKTNTLTLIL